MSSALADLKRHKRSLIARHARASDWLGMMHVGVTLVPLALLWWIVSFAGSQSPALVVLSTLLIGLFILRCFALMHDCGHGSLFKCRALNRWFGFLFGVQVLFVRLDLDATLVGLAVEDLGKIGELSLPPALGVEGAVDEGGHVLLHEWEDRSPGAQGQVQQRLTLLRPVRDDLNHAEILRRSPQLHRVPAGHYADGDPVAQDR